MKLYHAIRDKLETFSDYVMEPLAAVTLIEIAADRRVLIEHHMGVTAYSENCITVQTSFGNLTVNGCNLTLNQMSHFQLIISGTIQEMKLCSREDGIC